MLPRSVSVGFDNEFRRALSWEEVARTRHLGAGIYFTDSQKKDRNSRSIKAYIWRRHGAKFALRNPRPFRFSAGVRIYRVRLYCSARDIYPYSSNRDSFKILAPLSIGRFTPGHGVPHFSKDLPVGISLDDVLDIPSDLYQMWANQERRLAYSTFSLAPEPKSVRIWTSRTWEIFRQYLGNSPE